MLYIRTITNNLVERYEPREAVKIQNTHMKMWAPFPYSHRKWFKIRVLDSGLEQDELLFDDYITVLIRLCGYKTWNNNIGRRKKILLVIVKNSCHNSNFILIEVVNIY